MTTVTTVIDDSYLARRVLDFAQRGFAGMQREAQQTPRGFGGQPPPDFGGHL